MRKLLIQLILQKICCIYSAFDLKALMKAFTYIIYTLFNQ